MNEWKWKKNKTSSSPNNMMVFNRRCCCCWPVCCCCAATCRPSLSRTTPLCSRPTPGPGNPRKRRPKFLCHPLLTKTFFSLSVGTGRVLTLLYLPVFNMGLLLAPIRLSYDYTNGSIPLIEHYGDWRNAATLLFYTVLLGALLYSWIQRKVRPTPIDPDEIYQHRFSS